MVIGDELVKAYQKSQSVVEVGNFLLEIMLVLMNPRFPFKAYGNDSASFRTKQCVRLCK